MHVLMFQLAANIGSFGGITSGATRPTDNRPTHSALLGVIGSVIGAARRDPIQPALAAGLAFATRCDSAGAPLSDFQVSRAREIKAKEGPMTRGMVVEGTRPEDLISKLSTRIYLQDLAFSVAMILKPDAPVTLESVAERMVEPVFAPYVGRKSCPLALPLAPQIYDVEALDKAFAAYDAWREGKPHKANPNGVVAVDHAFINAGLVSPEMVLRSDRRRDYPVSRAPQAHINRVEHVLRAA